MSSRGRGRSSRGTGCPLPGYPLVLGSAGQGLPDGDARPRSGGAHLPGGPPRLTEYPGYAPARAGTNSLCFPHVFITLCFDKHVCVNAGRVGTREAQVVICEKRTTRLLLAAPLK